LRARKNEVLNIVTVTEGKVSFSGKDTQKNKSIYLMAGDKGLLNTSNNTISLEENQDSNFLAWKTGKLVFKNTPLDKVASDLSNYFNTNIQVQDSSKMQIPFTSTFDNQNLIEILTILKLSLGIKADSSDQGIMLE
jgi:ferric-dicitrate binding protein FerR (iron transport regulator)